MSAAARHRADVAKLAPALATAIRGVLADQKAALTKRAAKLSAKDEVAKTKAAVLPSLTKAVGIGAARAAAVTGATAPTPNTDLAGAWSYKFADQFTTTTQKQLDDLTDTADTDDVAGVLDARAGLALAMATTIVSNAINAGGQDYAATLPQTAQPTKTSVVTDDNPCTECSSVTSETVPASENFSNGSPHGPYHVGCNCTVDWTAATSSRSQRTDRMELWTDEEWRKQMSSAEINDLPDATFAYIEPGGKKDDGGKTVPRSLRHYPINDAAHVRNALARAAAQIAGDNEDAKAIAEKALPAIKAAAKKLGIGEEQNAATKPCPTCDGTGKILDGHRKCPDCGGTGKAKAEKASANALAEYRRRKAESLKGLERRSFPLSEMEVREVVDGDTLRFTGYASLTETPYEVGPFTETIKRGAFKRTLAESPDVQLLINHEGLPIARTGKNMTLTEDERGLFVQADLDPEDPDVARLARKMSQGLVDQMSFAFSVTDQEWSDDYSQRSVKSCSIHRGDVSIVNQGASPTTTASLRGLEAVYEYTEIIAEFRSLPVEQRDPTKLSAAASASLTKIAKLAQIADDAMDEAIPLLAKMLNEPNPNADSDHNADGTPKKPTGGTGAAAGDGPHSSTATDGSSRTLHRQLTARRAREELVMRGGPARRARTPVAVMTDPTGKQTCPICTGEGKVTTDKRSCTNCGGKGWVRKASS